MGGVFNFFGKDKLSFTKLAATANAGATQITVENVIERNFDGTTSAASDGSLNWEVGDEIVVASSTLDYSHEDVRTITGVSTQGSQSVLTLNQALTHRHYGEVETYGNNLDSSATHNPNRNWDIDLRAEVALLSRNVRITGLASQDTDVAFGDRALAQYTNFGVDVNGDGTIQSGEVDVTNGVGAHTMIMRTAGPIAVDGVQFDLGGQAGRQGRYPIHWHLAEDRASDVLRNTSITNSNNRGVTIHGTQNLTIEGVVLHDIHGHGVFFEDGVETGNELTANIALGIHKVGGLYTADGSAPNSSTPDGRDNIDPFQVDVHDRAKEAINTFHRFESSSAFWVTNPANSFVGNIAAGSEGSGFWFALPSQPIGAAVGDSQYDGINPNRTSLGQFAHNSAHSTGVGLIFDRGVDIDPNANPNAGGSFYDPFGTSLVDNFTAYKNNAGTYFLFKSRAADKFKFDQMKFADNGWSHFYYSIPTTNSLFVGHSRGNADLSERVGGNVLYDGPGQLYDSHFAGFAESNAHAFIAERGAQNRTHHIVSGLSFENDGSYSNVSILNDAVNGSATTQLGIAGVIFDQDGSLTSGVGGGAGFTVVADLPFNYQGDDFRPTGWDAWVSDDVYASFRIERDRNDPHGRDPMYVISPDGDRELTRTPFNGYGAIPAFKVDSGDYAIEFAADFDPSVDAIELKYQTFTGPIGAGFTTVILKDIGDVATLDRGTHFLSLAELRNASTDGFYFKNNGDIYLKAGKPGANSSFTRTYSIIPRVLVAGHDSAVTDEDVAVTINVLANDSDADGDLLTVSPVVADYGDDFQADSPAARWQYLWNETGSFGNESNYSALVWNAGRYRPNNLTYPFLGESIAHPGDGSNESSDGRERYSIAAFTIPVDGFYSIEDSVLSANANSINGVNVSAHVSGGAVMTLGNFAAGESGDFDSTLGYLSEGQVVYVGLGANATRAADGSAWDFSIVRNDDPANGQLTYNSDNTILYTPNQNFRGVDTFTYVVNDGNGNFDAATVTVSVDPMAPVVTSFERVGGGNFDGTATLRPDLVSPVSFTFGEDVIVDAGDLEISNATLGGTAVSTAGIGFSYDSTNFTATWDLSALTTPLEASFYDIGLDSASIQSVASGLFLDGDENGDGGDPFSASFYLAIPGDADLDGQTTLSIPNLFTRINTGDVATARRNVGAAIVSWALGDFDGNGEISLSIPNLFTRENTGDVAVARRNVGRDVRPVAAATAGLSLASPEIFISNTTDQAPTAPPASLAISPVFVEPVFVLGSVEVVTSIAADESSGLLEVENLLLRPLIFTPQDELETQVELTTEEAASIVSELIVTPLSGSLKSAQPQENTMDRDSLFADLGDHDIDDDSLADVAFPIAALVE